MKFYHYTSTTNLCGIVDEFQNTGTEQFRPRRSFIPPIHRPHSLDATTAERLAIFGMLDPLDEKWCRTIHSGQSSLLEIILDGVPDNRVSLLEIDVTPVDDIHIADWGVHLRKDRAARRSRTALYDEKMDYWRSLMPLRDYMRGDISYDAPEVVCFSALPLNQIQLVETWNKAVIMNMVRQKGGFDACYTANPPLRKSKEEDERTLKAFFADRAHCFSAVAP